MEHQVKTMLKSHKIDPDTYDFRAMWDSKLTAAENFDIIRTDLKSKGLWKANENELPSAKDIEKEAVASQIKMLKDNEAELLNSIRKIDVKGVENIESFKPAKELINALITGTQFGGFGLILEGPGGLGKSFLVEQELKKHKHIKYAVLSGHTTDLGFFTFVQRNNENDILLIDDISMSDLKSDTFKSLLKSCLWKTNNEAKRILRWTAFKTEQELNKQGLLAVFEVKPKFILICNDFPDDMDAKAIKSRCLYKKFFFSRAEKIGIMRQIAKNIDYEGLTEIERVEIVDYIEQNTAVYTKGLDIRTLVKSLFLRRNSENWKELVDDMFEPDEELKGIDKGWTQAEWCEHFGKARATYFRKKKEYQNLMKMVGE